MKILSFVPLISLIVSSALCLGTCRVLAKTVDVSAYGGDIGEALAAAKRGDIVFIASGTYEITATLSVPDGVSMKGQDKQTTVIRYSGESTLDMLSINGASDIELSGFTLDGAMTGYAAQGIVAAYANNLNIIDIRRLGRRRRAAYLLPLRCAG